MKKNILIDTDVGNDDLIAIMMLLLSSQNIQVMGISTVNGVCRSVIGAKNLARILSSCKAEIPIFQGAEQALVEKKAQFPMCDRQRAESLTLISDLEIPVEGYQVIPFSKLTEKLFNQRIDKKFIILALGPLTNIANLVNNCQGEIREKISKIILMGGGIGKGNVPPFFIAEYNIWLDPEAARIVFSSGIPIIMVGIEATDSVLATAQFQKRVNKIKPINRKAQIIREIILKNTGDFDAFYDPVAALVLLENSLITKGFRSGIDVVLAGKNRGQTVLTSENKNVYAVTGIKAELFYNKMLKLQR